MAAFGIVLVAAACSDSNEVGVAPVRAVEKSTAIAQGDAVCARLRTDIQQTVGAFEEQTPNPNDAQARDFLTNTLFPRIDRGVGDMHRVGKPTKDRAAFDEALRSLDDDLTTLKQAASNDPVELLDTGIELFDSSADNFVDYGFTECGKN
jgi:hypothetical protein